MLSASERALRIRLIAELRAQDDGFDQRIKTIALRGKIGLHGIDQRFIGELQRPIERSS